MWTAIKKLWHRLAKDSAPPPVHQQNSSILKRKQPDYPGEMNQQVSKQEKKT